MLDVSSNTQIGIGLAGFGIAFIFLGIVLLFDKGLLAIGNVSMNNVTFVPRHFRVHVN